MRNDTTERLDQLLDFVAQAASGTKDFVIEQAPMVAREIVAYTFWTSAIAVGFGLLCLVVACAMARWTYRSFNDSTTNDGREAIGLVLAIFATASALVMIGANVGPLIKSATAPRLVVIDYVRGASQ